MSEMSNGHERWSEELAAYLLGGLEPEEMTAFERHAEGCERCRAEMRWLMPAMQALPESVERVEVPPGLRDRMMSEVRADAAAADGDLAPAAERSRTAGRDDRTGNRPDGWRHWLAGRGEGRRGLRPAVGLAALLLVVAAVTGYVVGNDGASSPNDGPSNTVVSGQAPGVVATMVREGRGGSLHLRNVKPIPDGKVLEAWVQRNGKVRPVPALFVPDREGRATTTVASMDGVETVMVTIEPAGGTTAPTSAPLVTMPIPG
ncbi:MAG: anti-sigma factor [Solirubrobacterales bacterium]